MDYEKKYKEALEKARQLCAYPTTKSFINDLQDLFPELKESEDEKVRKEIINYFAKGKEYLSLCSIGKDDILAWLEKQAEQKPTVEMKSAEESLGISSEEYNKIVNDCIFGVDKVKPKFKIGEWVIYSNEEVHLITGFDDNGYLVDKECYIPFNCEGNMRLWTIADAKNGDVLYHKAENGIEYIVMSKGLNKHNNIDSYFRYSSINGFGIDIPSVLSAKCDSITPATKEQRDLLFQKMKEDGYEWDAEKKELKKIEDEEYNGEDYGIDGLWHAMNILEKTLGKVSGYQTDDGILSHKCAITAVKKLYEQKPAWSEEDEKTFVNLISYGSSKYTGEQVIEWLNSLKQRMGGK